MKTKIGVLFLVAVLCYSCNSECTINPEISNIPMTVNVTRFDMRFADASPSSFSELKRDFPQMFAPSIPDSVYLAKLNDTIQQELNEEVIKAFPNFETQAEDLHQLFQHLAYYFPEFKAPEVITVTSEVDYRNRVILSDNLLLIALDTYLGTDHKFYVGIQQYLKNNFRRSQLVPNVAQEYANQLIRRPESRTFLAYMIYYGKQLYLQDLLLPCIDDAEKIGYLKDDMSFARNNEDQVWRYFVERELLFKTNTKLQQRFLNEGPFSKFYLEIDNETPPKLGQYIGWQIVKQYMERNSVSLQQLLKTDAEIIFKNSKYKPNK